MVLSAKIHIEGLANEHEGIQLLTCEYRFFQETDKQGLTTSKVMGGLINLSFSSIEDNEIIQWMMSEDADKNGKILFSNDGNTKAFRTLEFKDARLISYHEYFTEQSKMITKLSLTVRLIRISGIEFSNTWMGYKPTSGGPW